MSPKSHLPPNSCSRRVDQRPARHSGKRCRRSTKKSHKLVESYIQHDQPVQMGVILWDAPLSDDAPGRAEPSLDLDRNELTSNSVHLEPEEEGEGLVASSNTEIGIEKSPNNYMITDKTKPMYLIEGKKAIVVDARPWPARVHESVTDSYKEPNPKLTPAELRRQAWQVAQRRAIDINLRKERFRQKLLLYTNGIYCLPKTLLKESKTRLFQWYLRPIDNKTPLCQPQLE